MSSNWHDLWGSDWRSVKPFFERFRSPTEIQRRAIPIIREGRDALVIAPTASGKTEAILPPLLSQHGDIVPDDGPLIVYVAPTRALVSDVVKRIRGPVRRLGGIVGERTSDRRTWSEGDPCTVLVTTPESLDSITMRASGSLSSIRGFITDEIHLLEGGPRGLQLRLVLERIEATTGRKLQRVLASATLPHIEALAERWCEDPEIIEVSGAHALDVTLIRRDQLGDFSQRVREQIEEHESTKVLAFANSRTGVEAFATDMADQLEEDGWVVRTHHSSLSRDERVQAERLFRERDQVLIAATSTLEVGIDIGDVDLVVLDGPPFTLNSFLQRLGRGCRRTDRRRVVAIADSALDARIFEALTRAGREGRSDGRLAPPLLAVAIQQIASSMQQKALETEPGNQPFLTREIVEGLIAPSAGPDGDEEPFLRDAIEAAESIGYVNVEEKWDGSAGFEVLTKGTDLDRAIKSPRFHVCFTPSAGEIDVVLDGSGRTIGGIRDQHYVPGMAIQLSGQPWRITKVHSDKVAVTPLPSSMGPPPGFNGLESGSVSEELAMEVAKLVWPGWREGKAAVYREEDGYVYAHFIGYEAAVLFSQYLADQGYDTEDVTPFSLRCDRRWDLENLRPSPTDLKELAYRHPSLIEQLEDLGRLYGYIRDEYDQEQAQLTYDWEGIARRIRDLEVEEVEPETIKWGLTGTDPVTPL